MPWRERTVSGEREAFVLLAVMPGANVSELCRRFGISRSNGFKWLKRYKEGGLAGLESLSRRPLSSPSRTGPAVETKILDVRSGSNEAWGGRKIAHVLKREGLAECPSASTITEVLRRNGRLAERAHEHPGPHRRFEHGEPNDLWQMDFKGHIATARGRCHPLTVLDDHSRYSIGVRACGDERDATVREQLTAMFRVHGLPWRMLADNGSPWGDSGAQTYTAFGVWLMRLDIRLSHGKPYHPQTQGKDERFHRTLKAEVLTGRAFADLADCQAAFDPWRRKYNHERPHQAIGMAVPADRYRLGSRSFPEVLPPIEYADGDAVRIVSTEGFISFKGKQWRIGKAFRGLPVALRPSGQDGIFDLRLRNHALGRINFVTGAREARGLVDEEEASTTTPPAQQRQEI